MKLISIGIQGHGFSGNISRFFESVLNSVVQSSEFLFKSNLPSLILAFACDLHILLIKSSFFGVLQVKNIKH